MISITSNLDSLTMQSSRNTGSRIVENLPVVSQDLPPFIQDRVAEFFLFSLYDACKAFGVDVKVGLSFPPLSHIKPNEWIDRF